jgi:Domain of unknown function (DUF4430)
VRRVVVLLLALAVAGCGGAHEHGTATLWVTREDGANVVYAGPVGAGSDGIRTVEQKLKVTTRYGGRYLQSVNGIAGSLGSQRDWFYFVNGVEGGQSAVDVKIRPGDVLWWDYRHWTGATMHVPVVLGAYPEPFLHGFDWVKPGASVVSSNANLAKRIAAQVGGTVNVRATATNFIVIGGKLAPDTARIRQFRKGVMLELGSAIARRLETDPTALRRRYGNVP